MLFSTPALDSREGEVVAAIDDLWEQLRYQLGRPRRWHGPLRRMVFARNVQASNSIEGYNVSLEDAAAIVDGQEAVESAELDAMVVRNYSDAMTYIVNMADDPTFSYDESLIKSLHFMMMKHDLMGALAGRFRPGAVYVWSTAGREVVYEGPDPEDVPKLVRELCDELDSEAPHSHWVRAAMGHLNLVMIHPFKDGNGRMARALQTLALARARIQSPVFLSIEEYLGRNTPEYYETLELVGGGAWDPGRDARPWVRFVLKAHYIQARTTEKRIAESDRLWSAIDDLRRRHSLDERTMGSLYFAAWGGRVRRRDHLTYAEEISDRVATSDLARLVAAGLLIPKGERRGRSYLAGDELRELREATREKRQRIADPFA